MRWFSRGDVDGFFGLALDNLVQLLLVDALCRHILGFSNELVYGRVLPGVAVSLVVGNLYYARQAKKLADETGRTDVCALPYGINTVSLFGHVFLVMLPAKLAAQGAGAADPARVAWQAGLAATLGSGVIELSGAFVAEKLRRAAPRAAMLSTLAGIALGFISLGFLFRTFARPIVGMTTLAVVLLVYFGRVRFKGRLPGGFVAVALGTLLGWITGIAPTGGSPGGISLHAPVPVLGDLLASIAAGNLTSYFAVIIPMGLFNVVGSLQNLESAEAAGDRYPTAPSLAVNGLGTLAAAAFGSCFPTTIYIGHPGWKAMGARAGYSILNAGFFTIVCLTGTLAHIVWAVPVDAGMAIVLWIGIVISAQAFQAVPKAHAPAVVVGLLPGVGAWGALLAKNGLRAAGVGGPAGPAFGPDLIEAFRASDTWIHGAFALEQGFIFTAMILSAATVELIERRFTRAAIWCWAGAALSAVGLMHSYRFTPGDTVVDLSPAWPWAAGYAAMGALFFLTRFVTEPSDGH
ncbi:MAG: NCS2 family permease [Myxococcales bacterium]|nr:NCS2 family permease [Myxococcales bacterium]MCB9581688.1 NCS2 family permease [Polyangiaceae bacterium]